MPNRRTDELNEEIRAVLSRKAEAVGVPEAQLRGTLRRSNRRLGRNALVLLLGVSVGAYGAVTGVRSLQRSAFFRPANSPQPPKLSPSLQEPAAAWLQLPSANSDQLRDLPLAMAGGEGAIWVTGGGNIPFPPPSSDDDPGAQPATLSRVDPGSARVTGTVEMGQAGDIRVVAAFGDAWVLRPGLDEVIRVDGTSLAPVAEIAVPDPVAGVDDGSSLWVVSGGTGVVSRIDPGTNQVADTIQTQLDASGPPVDQNGSFIPPYNGTPVVGIAASQGSVWVHGTSGLVRIDAASKTLASTMSVDGRVEGLAAGEAGVWISVCTPATPPCAWEVAEVDPSTNTISDRIPIGESDPGPSPGPEGSIGRVGMAVQGDTVWAALAVDYQDYARGSIIQIDPATHEVVAAFSVKGGNGTDGVGNTSDIYGPPVAQDGFLWILNVENDEVVRLELQS